MHYCIGQTDGVLDQLLPIRNGFRSDWNHIVLTHDIIRRDPNWDWDHWIPCREGHLLTRLIQIRQLWVRVNHSNLNILVHVLLV